MSQKIKLEVVPLAREPWPSLVDYLKERLAEAERGDIRGLVLAFEYTDGTTGCHTFHLENSYPAKLVGEIEGIKHTILHREHERKYT